MSTTIPALVNLYIEDSDRVVHIRLGLTYKHVQTYFKGKVSTSRSYAQPKGATRIFFTGIKEFIASRLEREAVPGYQKGDSDTVVQKKIEDYLSKFNEDEKKWKLLDLGIDITHEFKSFVDSYGVKSSGYPKSRPLKRSKTFSSKSKSYTPEMTTTKPIFISHASKDADIATHFVKYYLRDGLEISMDQVFYTSHAATGIDAGEDFRTIIKQALKNAKVVILLISENFKASQYCIAEMGAAWGLDKVMIPICIPPFDRVGSGQLLGPLQYIDVNNRLGMTRLRDQLVKNHGVGKIVDNSVHWQEALDDFLAKAEKKITELEAEAGKK